VIARYAQLVAGGSLVALLLLCAAWELWLAPLRPGGSWMALKALPLMLPLPGVARGRIYTFQWALLLIPAYFAEGVMRAWSDRGPAVALAWMEIALALAFFVGAVCYVRVKRRAH
jgi:uncharacterized membrane protein